ncbi:unnamed protein product [Rotaria sp. Silwood2]|nr:unnamed protein product [Rotaria sp. Silwood2]
MYLDKGLSSGLFKNEITKLIIGIDPNQNDLSTMENICNLVFTVCNNLTHLIFYDVSYKKIVRLISDFLSLRFSSSTLLVLNIKVQTFDICLYILNGRFSQLHTLYIDLTNIYLPEKEVQNQLCLSNNQMNFPSQEDIQQTFRDFQYTKIISRVDYFSEVREEQCHVYSYPFLMQHYEDISNNFPGRLYPYVRVVSLYDENPFEHEFFLQISQSFSFMQKLSLINHHAKNHK